VKRVGGQLKNNIMATKKSFSKESTIYVSVPSKLNLEQTHAITGEILRIAGCPTCYSGFKFQFLDEAELISAQFSANSELKVG
jgi:hypothetical protein